MLNALGKLYLRVRTIIFAIFEIHGSSKFPVDYETHTESFRAAYEKRTENDTDIKE